MRFVFHHGDCISNFWKVGVFSRLTNSYCLVALGGSEPVASEWLLNYEQVRSKWSLRCLKLVLNSLLDSTRGFWFFLFSCITLYCELLILQWHVVFSFASFEADFHEWPSKEFAKLPTQNVLFYVLPRNFYSVFEASGAGSWVLRDPNQLKTLGYIGA